MRLSSCRDRVGPQDVVQSFRCLGQVGLIQENQETQAIPDRRIVGGLAPGFEVPATVSPDLDPQPGFAGLQHGWSFEIFVQGSELIVGRPQFLDSSIRAERAGESPGLNPH